MWRILFISSLCLLQSEVVTGELGYHFSVRHNCTCDEMVGRCDTSCCCDQDCHQQARDTFNSSCQPDLGKHPLYNCSRNFTAFDSAFHDFLCIERSNEAFLGDFHHVPNKIETLSEWEQVTSEQEHQHTFEEAPGWRELENNTEHYKVGVSVKTVYDKAEGIVGKLSLPSQSLLGDCVTSHVRFLKDSKSVCELPINQTVCLNAKNTFLDHQMYIMTSPVIASEANFPQVLARNNFLESAVTETNYYFTTRLHTYFNLHQHHQRPLQSRPENLSNLAERISSYKASDSIFQTDDFRPYDKVQSVAHLDPDLLSCNNLVLEVRYELFWSGSKILKVAADVLLGNISIAPKKNKEKIILKQHFQTIFTHQANSSEEPTILRRSGNPGYQMGSPLVFARPAERESLFEHDPSGLRVWGSNSASSLCEENNLSEVKFGENLLSSCYIRLQQRQLDNCQDLKESISELQDSLLGSRYVARGGDHNFTGDSDQVLSIIFENVTEPVLEEVEGCLVPAKVRLTVLVVMVEYEGRVIQRINGLRVTPVFQHWRWRCKINSSGPRECRTVQNFLLSTEVEFLEIPNIWHHENTTRFWLQQDEIKCNGDICWGDLMSPLGSLQTGDSVAEMVQLGLAVILLVPTTLYFYRLQLQL